MIMSDEVLSVYRCPLVTFALLAFNQEKYIQDAVESAFAQTYEPLEILISDDASTDRTYEIIKEIVKDYRGPHKVMVNRNNINEGLIRHVNKIFGIARSEIIVMAAGDDISVPCRTDRIVKSFLSSEDVYLVHSNVIKIDEDNKVLGVMIPPIIEKKMLINDIAIAEGIHIGASAGYRKSIYKYFGPIERCDVYEDLILGFRSSLLGKIAYLNESLVNYRHGVGLSTKDLSSKNKILSSRMKYIKRSIANLTQRSIDCAKYQHVELNNDLQFAILKEIRANRMRYLFYKRTCLFISGLFTKRRVDVFNAFIAEIKFLIWKLSN